LAIASSAARKRVRAAAERGDPAVAARHNGIEEEALLVRDDFAHCQILLQQVVVVEGVRTPHDADSRIGKKADRAHEKVALRHKLGIKIRDEMPIGVDKRMADVAGLGMIVVRSRDVAGALGFAEGFEPW
jgi:hypothetical protein